ncbi:hypothetical protein BKA65DRAFT_551338 [Rhexocercosporidium sp. MPI-PUGE-AT-0058]|nr:hypothetical protein BKA65DRAFT_551338 [Rhexocercosporidium sp. MPI-PUGE-AT-0058]
MAQEKITQLDLQAAPNYQNKHPNLQQWGFRTLSVVSFAVMTLILQHSGFQKQWDALSDISHESGAFQWMNVPLDWQDPSDDLRASIAMIRLNATDRKDYKGSLFINPGGPGGSGVWYVKTLGQMYQTIVGKNYDIIGFDPRGIGMTRPLIDCWNRYQHNVELWALSRPPVIDAHPGILYDAYAQAGAFSKQCASTSGGGPRPGIKDAAERRVQEAGPVRFVGAASVARDMLEMTEKLGEEKLKFWGFSYGTVLASMFGTLFPDKVGRIVSDGNVDIRGWMMGSAVHFIDDAHKIMSAFYHLCYLARPSRSIKKKPVIVPAQNSSSGRPELIFSPLAEALAGLEVGNGEPFLKAQGVSKDPITCDNEPELKTDLAEGTADAFVAIMCSEANLLLDTPDDLQKYVDTLTNLSTVTGAIMAQDFRLQCAGWTVRSKWNFTSPFTANPACPILFIANSADNHTSLAAPSKCKAAVVNAYFQNGTLPENELVCEADIKPFDPVEVGSMSGDEVDFAMYRLMNHGA